MGLMPRYRLHYYRITSEGREIVNYTFYAKNSLVAHNIAMDYMSLEDSKYEIKIKSLVELG